MCWRSKTALFRQQKTATLCSLNNPFSSICLSSICICLDGAAAGGSKDSALLAIITQDMKALRGRELLPYTKFSVFENNIRKFVKECREPIFECLRDVSAFYFSKW